MRNFLLMVMLAATITSCSHNDLPDPPGNTISRIDYDMNGAVFSDKFKYDGQNRLIQLTGNITSLDIIYDSQGYLSGAILKDIASGAVMRSLQFTHDANGRINKKTINVATSATIDMYYRYDASGKVVADSQQVNNTPVTRVYTYNERGNVTRMEQINYTGGVPATIHVTTRRYDNKLSPYHKVNDVLFYITDMDFTFFLSLSNITGSTIDGVDAGRTYFYEYYSNGLPRSVIQGDSSPFRQLQKIVYTYVLP